MKKTFFFLLFLSAFSGLALADETTPPVPIGGGPVGNPLGGAQAFYTTALAVGGLLAFGAIVYAAIQYALARGNPGMQSDAREGITQAILGLLLLIGAFLVLRVINPGILTPSIPVPQATAPPPAAAATSSCVTVPLCRFAGAAGNSSLRCPPGFNRNCAQSNWTLSVRDPVTGDYYECTYLNTQERVGTEQNCIPTYPTGEPRL